MQAQSFRIIHKQFSDYNIHWLVITIKLVFIFLSFACNIAFRKLICPLVPFGQAKRYISSVVNLLSMKFILIMLGFFKFECDGFRFFSRESGKITLKSGYVGIGTHNSIIDYIYYSYLLNPVFIKMVILKKPQKDQTLYCPLSFLQSVQCALDYRGFDPIIIHSEKELKKIKYRKMTLKTLISQCFQELNGPVFIMLPGLNSDQYVSFNKQISLDIHQNEIRFQRSLVGFYVKVDPRLKLNQQAYKNQFFFMMDQMYCFCSYSMYITAVQFRRMKSRYDRYTYAAFIDSYYQGNQLKVQEIEYEEYLKELDALEQISQQKQLLVQQSKRDAGQEVEEEEKEKTD